MKLANGMQDVAALDPRNRGAGKDAAEPSSDASTRFAGVLSEIGPAGVPNNVLAPTSEGHTAGASVGHAQLGAGASAASLIRPRGLQTGPARNAGLASGGSTAQARASDLPRESPANGRLASNDGQPTAGSNGGLSIGKPPFGETDNQVVPANDIVTMFLSNSNLTGSRPTQTAIASQRPELRDSSDPAYERFRHASTDVSDKDKELEPAGISVLSGTSAQNDVGQPASSGQLMAMLLSGLGASAAQAARADSERCSEPSTNDMNGAPKEAVRQSTSGGGLSEVAPTQPAVDSPAVPSSAPIMSDVSIATHLTPNVMQLARGAVNEARNPVTAPTNLEMPKATNKAAEDQTARAVDLTADEQQEAASPSGRGTLLRSNTKNSVTRPSTTDGISRSVDETVRLPGAVPMSEASSSKEEPAQSPSERPQATKGEPRADRDGHVSFALAGDMAAALAPIAAASSTPVTALTTKISAAVAQLLDQDVGTPGMTSTGVATPARSLNLHIEQAGLGVVAVRMHLSGGTLEVHLTTSDRETLTLLRRDHGVLASAMGTDHYQLHSLTIQDGGAAPSTGGSHVGSGDTGGSARSDSHDTSDQRGGRENAQSDPRSSERQGSKSEPARSAARNSRRSSLFV